MMWEVYVRCYGGERELVFSTEVFTVRQRVLAQWVFAGAAVDESVIIVELYRSGRLERRVDKQLSDQRE